MTKTATLESLSGRKPAPREATKKEGRGRILSREGPSLPPAPALHLLEEKTLGLPTPDAPHR